MIRADVELGLLVSVMVIVIACSVSETRTRHDLVLSVDVLRSSRTCNPDITLAKTMWVIIGLVLIGRCFVSAIKI